MIAATLFAVFAPSAQAAAPGDPGHQSTTTDTTSYKFIGDPAWLTAKSAHRVRSGITATSQKGDKTSAYVMPVGSVMPASDPVSKILPYWSTVYQVWEPGNGNSYANFGPGTARTDSYGALYSDQNFINLCGPGAADIALEYWPAPPNRTTALNVQDTDIHNHTITSWDGTNMRGYMTYMAWQTNWPYYVLTPWHTGSDDPTGMMDNFYYPSKGVTLYGMLAGLNWEASGRSTSNWINYYYAINWWNANTQASLHADVVIDVANNNVPVVAEVDPTYLGRGANWRLTQSGVHHFITIIGYDDSASTYKYVDTCGTSTGCNTATADPQTGTVANTDNSTYYTVGQSAMWNAITAIPVNQSTARTAGDGGWVW